MKSNGAVAKTLQDRHQNSNGASRGRNDPQCRLFQVSRVIAWSVPSAGQTHGNVGLIAGYQAEIDVHHLANTITIFIKITIADHRREDYATFEKRVEKFPEVVEC
ncbi:MAG: hypothetical protein VX090_16475, partial [Pseudomonadota bacterium]|nr:hypothetical protein [Pseudomonadota bacterium]